MKRPFLMPWLPPLHFYRAKRPISFECTPFIPMAFDEVSRRRTGNAMTADELAVFKSASRNEYCFVSPHFPAVCSVH